MGPTPRNKYKTLFQQLQKEFRSGVPAQSDDREVLVHLIYSALLENTTSASALEAFEIIENSFIDWNELRVSTAAELSALLPMLNEPRKSCERVRQILQSIFQATYRFDLEEWREKGEEAFRAFLGSIPYVTRFMTNYTVSAIFRKNYLPLDEGALRVLRLLELVDIDAENHEVPIGLDRVFSKSDFALFARLLHELGAMLMNESTAARAMKILKTVDPESIKRSFVPLSEDEEKDPFQIAREIASNRRHSPMKMNFDAEEDGEEDGEEDEFDADEDPLEEQFALDEEENLESEPPAEKEASRKPAPKSKETKKAKETKPAEEKKPAETNKVSETKKPVGVKKSAEEKKSAETNKVPEAKKPARVKKSAEEKKPAETNEVPEAKKPARVKKPVEEKKPAELKRTKPTPKKTAPAKHAVKKSEPADPKKSAGKKPAESKKTESKKATPAKVPPVKRPVTKSEPKSKSKPAAKATGAESAKPAAKRSANKASVKAESTPKKAPAEKKSRVSKPDADKKGTSKKK
ncbi:MAG: hypothetical protein ACOX6D_05590 [Thermoguttaceae bacterium]|jgi:endonuclease III